jgi:hypothetical protein
VGSVSGYIKLNGVPKEIINGYVKVNGVWKQGVSLSDKVNGVWKEVWSNAYDAPSDLSYPTTAQRGSTFTWSVTAITGAAYEFQEKQESGAWGTSKFFTSNSNSYTVTTNVTINTLQLRVRTVDPNDHSNPSAWIEGPVASLTPEKLDTPTGLTIPASISRGTQITASWNGLKGQTYSLEVSYANSSDVWRLASISGTLIPLAADGKASMNYFVSTDTTDKKVKFRLKTAKTGYLDSDYSAATIITLGAQKLGTVSSLVVPNVLKGESVKVTWGAVTNADSYQLEVDYNRSGSWSRLYTGANKTYTFTYPKDKTNVQMRVRATATDYTTGDWRYAWTDYQTMTLPPLKNKTWTATWTGNWRPNFGGEWNANNSYVYQGKWTDSDGTWGNYKGIAIFNAADIENTLDGKDVEKVQIYFYRVNAGGYVSGQQIELYTHNYTSHPAGQPTLSYVQGPFSSFARGEGKWITVDNKVAERIRDGSAKGIGLYRSSGDGYLFMSTNVQLYVEYR